MRNGEPDVLEHEDAHDFLAAWFAWDQERERSYHRSFRWYVTQKPAGMLLGEDWRTPLHKAVTKRGPIAAELAEALARLIAPGDPTRAGYLRQLVRVTEAHKTCKRARSTPTPSRACELAVGSPMPSGSRDPSNLPRRRGWPP